MRTRCTNVVVEEQQTEWLGELEPACSVCGFWFVLPGRPLVFLMVPNMELANMAVQSRLCMKPEIWVWLCGEPQGPFFKLARRRLRETQLHKHQIMVNRSGQTGASRWRNYFCSSEVKMLPSLVRHPKTAQILKKPVLECDLNPTINNLRQQ